MSYNSSSYSVNNLLSHRNSFKSQNFWTLNYNQTVREWNNTNLHVNNLVQEPIRSNIRLSTDASSLKLDTRVLERDKSSPRIETNYLPCISLSNFYKPQKYPLNNAPRPPILIQRPSLSDSTLMLSEKPDKAAYKQKSITYEDEISKRSVLLPSPKFPKTVIFDLDETLVHCSKFVDPNDTVLKVKLPNHQIGKLGVKIRPFVKEVLDELSSKFEILIFTASNSTYADPILDLIDPDRKYITYRLYRQHCIPKGKHKLKDLRIFSNRSLKDLVIIDNSLSCFSQQIDNGILISSWFGDTRDRELLRILSYLNSLSGFKDVRDYNRRNLNLFSKYKDINSIL